MTGQPCPGLGKGTAAGPGIALRRSLPERERHQRRAKSWRRPCFRRFCCLASPRCKLDKAGTVRNWERYREESCERLYSLPLLKLDPPTGALGLLFVQVNHSERYARDKRTLRRRRDERERSRVFSGKRSAEFRSLPPVLSVNAGRSETKDSVTERQSLWSSTIGRQRVSFKRAFPCQAKGSATRAGRAGPCVYGTG